MLAKIDYSPDYRPESYWDPSLMAMARIKGDIRQSRVIHARLVGELEKVPKFFFAESQDPRVVEIFATKSAAWRGGESLPDHDDNEVEIARITLHPDYRYVISLRAREEKGLIHYRVASEHEAVEGVDLPPTTDPLTFRELLGTLRSIRSPDDTVVRTWWREMGMAEGIAFAIASLQIQSVYYPAISAFYRRCARRWATQALNEFEHDGQPSLFGGFNTPVAPLSPLHVAVLMGDRERVRHLVRSVADVEAKIDPGIRSLIDAVPTFRSTRLLVPHLFQQLNIDPDAILPNLTAHDLARNTGDGNTAAFLSAAEKMKGFVQNLVSKGDQEAWDELTRDEPDETP